MNEYAIIVDGVVANTVKIGEILETTDALIDVTGQSIQLGQTWNGSSFGPVPAKPQVYRKRLSVREFREQFTAAEKTAIYTAAKTVVDVEVWLDDLRSVEYVDVDFPQTIDSVIALETAGLIGPGRAAEILEGILE